jgi:Flp pilus assembly protein TadD
MKPCAKAMTLPTRLLAAALLLTLAACGGSGGTRPGPSSKPSRPAAETPADQAAADAAKTAADKAAAEKGNPEERFKASLELMRTKKTAEAEAALLKLAQDFPDFAGPQMNLGILYAKSNRLQIAISAFNKAATANPQNAAAFNWLGIAYRESGNYPLAQQAYEKALAAKPNYPAVHLNLGILLDEYMKRPADAIPHYRQYLQQYGKEDLRVLAWIAEIEAAQKTAAPAAATGGAAK